jgi:hypothetical protein
VRPIRAPIDVTYGASDVVPASYTQYPFNRLVNPIFNSAIFNTAVSIGDGSASILKESLRLFVSISWRFFGIRWGRSCRRTCC